MNIGGYSNSGVRGEDFQKSMFSKKKRVWSRLSHFSPKIIVISKKKVFISVSSLISLFCSLNQGVL